MKTRRFRLAAPVALGFVLVAGAQAGPAHRIVLANGTTLATADTPILRGTIYTFHAAPGGALTGVPVEMVTTIETTVVSPRVQRLGMAQGVIPSAETRPLQPGETLVLGPMGDGAPPPSMVGGAASNAGAMAPGASIPNGGYANGAGFAYGNGSAYNGASAPRPNVGPNGVPTALSSTDLSQALSSSTGPNGFPQTPSTSPTTVGPNGTPTLSPGVPGANTAGTQVIGPNGTPQTVAVPVMGPNGTPVLAQPGMAGAAQPVIGPNGTPILAPAGAPGTAPQQIGPNGTPVLAPPGGPGSAAPNVAPNGTPSSPAPAGSAPAHSGGPGR